jgi:asparagine synthase (glutamine-hydrolysing)
MCGIFAYLGNTTKATPKNYSKIKSRGPDNTSIKEINEKLLFVFHRLAVNGLDHQSDQPLCIDNKYLVCNGEIYNYRELCQENDFDYQSHSDCEIIIHMYIKYGIEKTVKSLDGVFAFVLYDADKDEIYASRDPIGIRSLFYGRNDDGDVGFCSEAKSLIDLFDFVEQFPSGHYWDGKDFHQYYDFDYQIIKDRTEEEICSQLKKLFTKAVDKRMMSDRRVCTLLSGGLDSTLVTALVKKHYPDYGLDTYAIGLEGSVDLYYARKAAEQLKTRHFEVVVTEQEFLEAIDKTILQIESFCTTTVRASVGNYLVSLYIKNRGKHEHDKEYDFKESGDTVVFCGDVSDEIFASYRGFQKADTPENFFKENVNQIKNIRYFDVLRSDKSISGAGLEARVPFADKAFVEYVMSIDPKLKMFDDKRMEKYLLRKAFEGELSDELLWRRKEAFSDGVSGHSRSWFEIIREFVDKQIPDEEFEERCSKYEHMRPYDKESLYYREIFEKYYPNKGKMIPYYWRHPFSTQVDPSARLLEHY